MKTLGMVVFVAGLALSGCFNINVPDINAPDIYLNGGSGGRPETDYRDYRDDNDDNDKNVERSPDRSGPSQLPASSGVSWREIITGTAGKVFLGSEQGVIFYTFDSLAYPNSPVDLVANLQSSNDLQPIAWVTVGFYDGDDLIGEAETDDKGRASLKWIPPGEGDYPFTARIIHVPQGAPKAMLDVRPSPLLISARSKDTRFVVIDLDHTVVDSSFFRVLVGRARAMPNSVEATRRIAGVYSIIYLTHRPDLMTGRSKAWLVDNGYPPGPLLVSQLKEAFGDSGKFKTAKLKAIRKAYPNVEIGIGDKLSDAQAYVDNGLTAYLIPNYKTKPKNMRKMARKIGRLRSGGRLSVVDGWTEIEAGIFKGRKFPPKTYARRLMRRAEKLEADEKARKRKKKKDDDDDDDD